MKHLSSAHASTEIVAKNTVADTVDEDSMLGVANMSSANKEGLGVTQFTNYSFDQ